MTEEKEIRGRRGATLALLKSGMAVFTAWVTHSCGVSDVIDYRSERSAAKKAAAKDANVVVSGPATTCDVLSSPKIGINNAEVATGDLIPQARFYGNAAWGMIAVQLLTSKVVEQLIITQADGTPLAVHTFSEADKRASGYHPIVIDHLPLRNLTKIRIVQIVASKPIGSDHDVAFFTTFNGRSVKDLGSKTVPPEFAANQNVAQFAEVAGSFTVDGTVSYPNLAGQAARSLQTANLSTTWAQPQLLPGTTTTDIMGNPLSSLGGAALLEYQCFCTYVLVGDVYYRSTLKIG